MKRDMDLIRELLLRIEAVPADAGTVYGLELGGPELTIEDRSNDEIEQHMRLLTGAGFVDLSSEYSGGYALRGLTWEGHDFIDSIRDPKIWSRTKEAAAGAGGFTVELLKDLAKGFLKTKIKELTGIDL